MSTAFYTSFVGRRALLAVVRERITASRVVTLTGAGGVGKTRVAVRIAEEATRAYPDGCWVVGLSETTGPEQVGPAVAEAIGVVVSESPWRVESLSDFIAHRRALLVLDNCEHVLAAVVDLVEHLRASCPGLHLLLTSRRPLHLSGEDVVLVPPLTLPAPDVPASPEALSHYEAVALFVDRATSVRSDFLLDAANAAAVADLCRELDGIPLAIELAAARVRLLTPQEILVRLGERLNVLLGGYRDVVDRQRSLRASVEWSFELCTASEQQLWARSSVFVGGFTLDAAAVVTSDEVAGGDDAMDRVGGLVDQAVLMTEEQAPGHTRYWMHDGIRDFGIEQVTRTGELAQVLTRHAEWFAHLAAQFRAEAAGPDQAEWLQRLRTEHPNIRAAIEHCLSSPALASTGLVVATDLDLYWSASGSLGEGREWLLRVLDTGAGTPERRGAAMAIVARAALLQNDRSAAAELLRQANTIAPSDQALQGRVLAVSAMLALREGRNPEAVAQAEQAVGLLESTLSRADQLFALFVAGVCHDFSGDDDAAVARHQRCISLAEQSGERYMKAFALAGLGEQALAVGEVDRARDLFGEMVRIKLALSDRMGVAVGLESLGRVAIARREGERAALLIGAAEGIWDLVGMSGNGGLFTFAPPGSDGIDAARRMLGKQQFRGAFRRGSQMSVENVVRYALDETIEPAEAVPEKVAPSPLTKREMEVAELVADGLSNPEIAARLVISVRTAQGHVENILRKLGFTSRSLVAAWMTERRLTEQASASSRPGGPSASTRR